MNKIHRLDENSIRQIAAGEVVERPASVVKELIENSLDAGSRRIALEIQEGGKKLIRVSDDGCGMNAEDALLAFERHTTSKILNAADLETLYTFGFRGEALPSISSIAKVKITTHAVDHPAGFSVELDGGKMTAQGECARAHGTTIDVQDLFFNVPARLKFLKSDATEKSRILKTFEEIAIAHPQIAFDLKMDQRNPSFYPARTENIDRIRDLWNDSFTQETMVPLHFDHALIKIEGWVSRPEAHQATRANQLFYVNSRPIVSRFLTHALYEAYRDALPVGRHPAAVIFITIDPKEVDVNVHPSKREVRFRSESQIYQALIQEIRARRSQGSTAPKVFSESQPALNYPDSNPVSQSSFFKSSGSFLNRPVAMDPSIYHAVGSEPAQSTAVIPPIAAGLTQTLERPVHVLASFQSLYVLAQEGENLVIVDQHAAAERILYEKFRAEIVAHKKVETQPLLFPVLWNVNIAQVDLLKNIAPLLESLGFKLELFGEKTFRIAETPAFIHESKLKDVLDEILKSVENEKDLMLIDEERIMTAACRAAIKANDPLSVTELSKLLKDLSQCSNPHTCPHGRPVTLVISKPELDKKFGRI